MAGPNELSNAQAPGQGAEGHSDYVVAARLPARNPKLDIALYKVSRLRKRKS